MRREYTTSAEDPEHRRSMAYATVHTHISLLTIKGASTVRRVVRTDGGKGSE
jgi:hypothetical protein